MSASITSVHPVQENYFALVVSILAVVPPEQAFMMLETGRRPMRGNVGPDDAAELARLVEEDGMTYREVGAMYGVGKYTVFYWVKKWKAESKKMIERS
jgi:hypothetical protein